MKLNLLALILIPTLMPTGCSMFGGFGGGNDDASDNSHISVPSELNRENLHHVFQQMEDNAIRMEKVGKFVINENETTTNDRDNTKNINVIEIDYDNQLSHYHEDRYDNFKFGDQMLDEHNIMDDWRSVDGHKLKIINKINDNLSSKVELFDSVKELENNLYYYCEFYDFSFQCCARCENLFDPMGSGDERLTNFSFTADMDEHLLKVTMKFDLVSRTTENYDLKMEFVDGLISKYESNIIDNGDNSTYKTSMVFIKNENLTIEFPDVK